MSRHHRKPKSRGGKNNKTNISVVTKDKHRAFHLLFSNDTPHQIAKILNEIWLDPDFKFEVLQK